jgi:hypothetical protein
VTGCNARNDLILRHAESGHARNLREVLERVFDDQTCWSRAVRPILSRSSIALASVYISIDLTRPLSVRSRQPACARSPPHAAPPLLHLTGLGRESSLSVWSCLALLANLQTNDRMHKVRVWSSVRSYTFVSFSFSKSTTISPLLPSC